MVTQDRLVEVFKPSRTDPIPLGVRLGDTVYASSVTGADPATGALAPDLGGQVEQALANLALVVERAGGTLDNVARVAAFVTSLDDREPFMTQWEAFFAPPRPACKVLVDRLPAGELVSLQVLALLGGTRERIDVPGVPARDPTIKIGSWILSSRVHGTDPATGELPEGVEEQAALAFSNIQKLAEIGGGTRDNISQLTVFLRDPQLEDVARRHFEAFFPDAASRPRLHVVEAFIPPKIQIMVEMMAAL